MALAMRLSFKINILNCTSNEVCKVITNTRVIINPEGAMAQSHHYYA